MPRFVDRLARYSELIVDPSLRSEQIVADLLPRLEEFGAAVVPSWINELDVLRGEFERAFREETDEPLGLTPHGKTLATRLGRTSSGLQLKLGLSEVRKRFPSIEQLFSSSILREVADGYVGRPNSLNRHVIFTDDNVPSPRILPFHFDEIGSLKFMVYLDDVDANSAPFQLIPGTHVRSKTVRLHEWLRTDNYDEIRHEPFEEFSDELFYVLFGHFKPFMLSMRASHEAPAGSLVVFDTDVLHGAGALAPNRRRRVIRSSTYGSMYPGN